MSDQQNDQPTSAASKLRRYEINYADATEDALEYAAAPFGRWCLASDMDALVAEHEAAMRAKDEERVMQLAAISTASIANTDESFAATEIGPDSPFYSVAYADVRVAIQREMKHRAEIARLAPLADAWKELVAVVESHRFVDVEGLLNYYAFKDDRADTNVSFGDSLRAIIHDAYLNMDKQGDGQ